MIQAVILILMKDDKIIFCKRSHHRKSLPNKWSLPAGKLEENETFIEGAKREAQEELRLKIYDLKLFDKEEIKKDGEEKILYFVEAKYDEWPEFFDKRELSEIREYSFEEFFSLFSDEEIGHGLQHLRKKMKF